jgi:hypothetical protein
MQIHDGQLTPHIADRAVDLYAQNHHKKSHFFMIFVTLLDQGPFTDKNQPFASPIDPHRLYSELWSAEIIPPQTRPRLHIQQLDNHIIQLKYTNKEKNTEK